MGRGRRMGVKRRGLAFRRRILRWRRRGKKKYL